MKKRGGKLKNIITLRIVKYKNIYLEKMFLLAL